LFIVLGVLAALQYRWTGELGDAERERMRRTAAESARQLSGDFDEEIARLASRFRFDTTGIESLEVRVADAVSDLDAESERLVRDVWIIPIGSADAASRRLERLTLEWRIESPPDYLRGAGARGMAESHGPRFRPLLPEVPALVIPSGLVWGQSGGTSARQLPAVRGPDALVVVEMDRQALSTTLLPELVRRRFGEDDVRAWSVAVIDRSAGTVVFSTENIARESSPDLTTSLFGTQAIETALRQDRGTRIPRRPGGFGGGFRGWRMDHSGDPSLGAWIVEIRHRAGTLDQAVARSRTRNLMLSGAVLVLLMAGGLITIANAHRSDALARQQMEFVAAVTHELNTPIAAISSAGQNLADGVVTEAPQIQRYGEVIAREGRRLATMVDHVLEFAGMRSDAFTIHLGTATVGDVVEHALASTAWLVEENGVEVSLDIHDGDREIVCDRDALVRAVGNLVSNAVKYRGTSNRIAVSTRVDNVRQELELSVTDQGLGLAPEDKAKVFEPFVRGANTRDGAIRGSGLGLAIVRRIVEAHRGRVSVESNPGRGSTFSIRIPVN
jgi:signal transduction histidine kinase